MVTAMTMVVMVRCGRGLLFLQLWVMVVEFGGVVATDFTVTATVTRTPREAGAVVVVMEVVANTAGCPWPWPWWSVHSAPLGTHPGRGDSGPPDKHKFSLLDKASLQITVCLYTLTCNGWEFQMSQLPTKT